MFFRDQTLSDKYQPLLYDEVYIFNTKMKLIRRWDLALLEEMGELPASSSSGSDLNTRSDNNPTLFCSELLQPVL